MIFAIRKGDLGDSKKGAVRGGRKLRREVPKTKREA